MENVVKADHGKPQLNLVPLEILEPLALVREFAVKKYGMDGIEAWREISDDRLLAALLRHTVAYQKDHSAMDEESGLPTAYHIAVNGAFLAIKAMDRMKEGIGYEIKEINFYEDLPSELQESIDKFISIVWGRGIEDESESDSEKTEVSGE